MIVCTNDIGIVENLFISVIQNQFIEKNFKAMLNGNSWKKNDYKIKNNFTEEITRNFEQDALENLEENGCFFLEF